MPGVQNVFIEHEFILSFFYTDSSNERTRENHETAKNYFNTISALKPPPLFFTTNFEILSVLSRIWKDSKNLELTRELKKRITQSKHIKIFPLSKREYAEAVQDFQKPDFKLSCEFLDLTSFNFIKNRSQDCNIKWVLAMQNDYYEAASLYGFEVWK